eukprot:4105802-Amphidinium_carterae.1
MGQHLALRDLWYQLQCFGRDELMLLELDLSMCEARQALALLGIEVAAHGVLHGSGLHEKWLREAWPDVMVGDA